MCFVAAKVTSDKCDTVTDISSRKAKIKEENRCFRCLRNGHISKTCRQKIYCYRCKERNSHNTALCTKGLDNQSNTNVAGNDEPVLLQTANGYISDPNEKKILSATILFDSCSQQTYVLYGKIL